MRSALECRAPFLDTALFQYVTHLPLLYHLAHGQGKAVLRKALPAWVPPEIRWREKQGFTPPLASWLRTELHERVENDLANYPVALREILIQRQRASFLLGTWREPTAVTNFFDGWC